MKKSVFGIPMDKFTFGITLYTVIMYVIGLNILIMNIRSKRVSVEVAVVIFILSPLSTPLMLASILD